MRTPVLLLCLLTCLAVSSQDRCVSTDYLLTQKVANPLDAERMAAAENYLQKKSSSASFQARTGSSEILRIPVVVHLLYNNASQNLSDEQVKSQLEALNRDFRRKNNDTVNTPSRFRSLAADVQVEFYLATADPRGRATTGIVRKYSATANWLSNDKIKFSAQGGDDAWDSKSYLNIWVGNLVAGNGYSSAPGGDPAKDGVVINTGAFGTVNRAGNFALGRTAVHEIGHWLGLKHIWGDAQCGDDGVGDTPQQGWYTTNCPSGFRSSCSNGELGDMYMNYMDYTADACMNLFTQGQKARMRSAFDEGGPRQSFLQTKGLKAPWLEEAPLALSTSTSAVYPNPAGGELNLQLGTDFVGKTVSIFNMNGVRVQVVQVKAALQKLDLSAFQKGMYFIKGDGVSEKFVRL